MLTDDEKMEAMAAHLRTVSDKVLSEGWGSWQTAPEGSVRTRVLQITAAEMQRREALTLPDDD